LTANNIAFLIRRLNSGSSDDLLRGFNEITALAIGAAMAAAWNYTMSRMLTWRE
jgi:putative flippase GtrA